MFDRGSKALREVSPVVILDFNKAAELAAANYFGLGQGIFEVNLRDSGGGEGDYALRLKVTRQA